MDFKIPFHRSWFGPEEIKEVVDTLESGWLTTGPKTHRFEEDFKEYIGCKHAIGLNSCTAGLHLSLMALGFSRGEEVITTPLTFPASANVIVHSNLTPVFADIEPGTLNIDPEQVRAKLTSRTRAILPVHFAGHACDMDALLGLAAEQDLRIVEDAAHALETFYKGKKIGGLGDTTSFSFYATKNITTGEGGMLTTNNDKLAEKIRVMRLHGLSRDAWKRYDKRGFAKWELHVPGFKYNMSDINAALGIHQLKKAGQFLELRKKYAARYDEAFRDVEEIETLKIKDYTQSAHHIYVIALDLTRLTLNRDQILDEMQQAGIGVAIHFEPLHLQPFYQQRYGTREKDFPVATSYGERILSLPLFPRMREEEVEEVIQTLTGLIRKYRKKLVGTG